MPSTNNTPNRVKFTVGRVQSFNCDTHLNEQLLWDADEKTLCIRARSGGGKSYYFQSRLNGKVIKVRIGNLSDKGLTISSARKTAREYQNLVDRGIDPRNEIKRSIKAEEQQRKEYKKQDVKFSQVWDEYVSAHKKEWSNLHFKDHQKAMASGGKQRQRSDEKTVAGVLHQFRETRLIEFSPRLIENWIKKEKKHRPTVTARGFRLLRACLNWADSQEKYSGVIDTHQIFKNKDVQKALPAPKAKSDALEKSHLPLWFQAVRYIDNQVISIYLQSLLLTGARREELATLRWQDVDFKWLSLRLKDKVENERIIPLTPYVTNLIHSLPKRNEWVFSSHQSQSGRLKDPYKAHSTALSKAGLPHVSLHGLRRSFGTLSEWVECPVGIVAQIQGHKPSALIEKHYRTRPLDLLRIWHNKIEKQILEFAGIEQPKEINEKPIRLIS